MKVAGDMGADSITRIYDRSIQLSESIGPVDDHIMCMLFSKNQGGESLIF